ncbi:MAG TPA: acylphosphatase [Tepidisphaeraceae bacterium]|jgi:acylphosphatase
MMTATSELTRQHCFFEGRVQGVGFRYTTRNIAINYNVSGFVRNLPDGRVELVAEGPENEVSAFVDAVSSRMGRYISGVSYKDELPLGDYPHFSIAR